jgi:hypothetical protein
VSGVFLGIEDAAPLVFLNFSKLQAGSGRVPPDTRITFSETSFHFVFCYILISYGNLWSENVAWSRRQKLVCSFKA